MYQSPFSTNEIKYFKNLMQNDNAEAKEQRMLNLKYYMLRM